MNTNKYMNAIVCSSRKSCNQILAKLVRTILEVKFNILIINKYMRVQFTLYIIYAALEILQPDFCNTYIILEVKVNKYFECKQRRVKKYWHLFFMFQYMKNMLWNTLPKYIILLQPIVLKETFVPFFNIADKPAFMLLSLRGAVIERPD